MPKLRPRGVSDESFEKLTPMQQAFIRHMSKLGDAAAACELAGYKHPNSRHQLMRDPMIVRHLRREAENLIKSASPAAALTLVKIATDESEPTGLRLKAADAILNKAGVGDAQKVEHRHVHALADASDGEIRSKLRALVSELANGPEVIDGEKVEEAEIIETPALTKIESDKAAK